MNNLNDLKIWNKAVDLSVEIYNLTNEFPEIEKFGLIKQQIKPKWWFFENTSKK